MASVHACVGNRHLVLARQRGRGKHRSPLTCYQGGGMLNRVTVGSGPRDKPQITKLAVGKVYTVSHAFFGTFIARVEEPNAGWCGFAIVESNGKLRTEHFDNGSYIELTSDFFRAIPL